MNASAWRAIAACLVASLVACNKDSGSTAPAPVVRITFSTAEVVANGSNVVTVSVSDPGGGPITVTTDRGTFPGGGQTASVAGAAGNVALLTCDATAASGCAGTVHVNAAGAGSSGAKTLVFGTLGSLCPNDCTADAGCATLTCNRLGGTTGTCSSTLPSACIAAPTCVPTPSGATTETSCTDGVDNDCSGAADGLDLACEGQPCQVGSPTFVWKSGACTDLTSGLGIKVTPARTRLPANGTTSTTVVVEVTSGDAPVAGMSVPVSATRGAITPASAQTGPDGKATFTFTSSATAGVAAITASLAASPTIQQTTTITMPTLGSFRLAANPVQFPVMGARGSGWNEFGAVQVQVLDAAGEPYPDGLAVTFEHRPLGGSTFLNPAAATAACPAATCVAHVSAVSSGTASPDTAGLASATLSSGSLAGTLAVTARATADGVQIAVPLPTAAVIGAKASGGNFSVVCGPRNVPALAETDCAVSLVDAPFTCEALLKDRFANVLGTATQVMFVSEAAAVGQVATTPAYDSVTGGADQMGLGIALQGFNTLGAGLPFDVTPDAASGEPSVIDAVGVDGCGPRTRNPRDGLVTVVAIADGEEAFFDANGSGSYDAGEPFVDAGEPFVDQDDDGQFDPGEWFLDVDGDRAYTPANGTWDATTKLWTQTVVVYTGTATSLAVGGNLLGTRWADLPLGSACTATAPATPFDLAVQVGTTPGGSRSYAVVASDLNLNFLTGETTYGAAPTPGTTGLEVTYGGLDQYADDLGVSYRYWPCASGGSGACAAQCRATGGPYPCAMRPAVTSYSCGLARSVTLTGGVDVVPFTAADWTVNVPWDVYGDPRVLSTVRTVTGRTH